MLFKAKTTALSFFDVEHSENKTGIEMNTCHLLK